MSDVAATARERRKRAAEKYKPHEIDLLLVAEAPPRALDRYFYFDDVREQDSLFRYVYRGVTGREPSRERKAQLLAELRDRGVFLIDLQEDLVGTPSAHLAPKLVERCRELNPRRIVLIKATVFDAAYVFSPGGTPSECSSRACNPRHRHAPGKSHQP